MTAPIPCADHDACEGGPCKNPYPKNVHAVALGQLGGKKGGKSTSEAKQRAARENGKKGGRRPRPP